MSQIQPEKTEWSPQPILHGNSRIFSEDVKKSLQTVDLPNSNPTFLGYLAVCVSNPSSI